MPNPPEPSNPLSTGAELERLVEIMRILRSPNGCPWDREQTVTSLRSFILEETYELLEAIDKSDYLALQEELGDYLFEAVFLAQLSSEKGHFTLADALRDAADKLIRRHPHVFNVEAETQNGTLPKSAEEVKVRWEQIKSEEKKALNTQTGSLGELPSTLPALLRAYRMGRRAATAGFDWKSTELVIAKVEEELLELKDAINEENAKDIQEELGDLLFSLANLSRHLSIEPEGALQKANKKFTTRFAELEQRFTSRDRTLLGASDDEMEKEWQQVKLDESRNRT